MKAVIQLDPTEAEGIANQIVALEQVLAGLKQQVQSGDLDQSALSALAAGITRLCALRDKIWEAVPKCPEAFEGASSGPVYRRQDEWFLFAVGYLCEINDRTPGPTASDVEHFLSERLRRGFNNPGWDGSLQGRRYIESVKRPDKPNGPCRWRLTERGKLAYADMRERLIAQLRPGRP